jgi:MraZ protein
MFRGSFEHSVDSKGRVSVPSRFRDILSERYEGKLVLTMDFDKCIMVYPIEEWERIEEKIKSLPQSQKEVKDYTRFVFSNATECELDKQGRILIPPPLRENAGINKSVMVVGILNKMEIWDKGAWDTRKSQTGDKIGEVLSTLGL